MIGFPWWLRGKEFVCQCRRHRFNPWSGKIPRAAWQLGPWATTTEPVLWSWEPSYRSPSAQCPWSATREATTVSSPHRAPSPQHLEEVPAQQWRPSTAKHNKQNYLKKGNDHQNKTLTCPYNTAQCFLMSTEHSVFQNLSPLSSVPMTVLWPSPMRQLSSVFCK